MLPDSFFLPLVSPDSYKIFIKIRRETTGVARWDVDAIQNSRSLPFVGWDSPPCRG